MYGSIFFHSIIPAQDASFTIDMNEWDEIQEAVSQAEGHLAGNRQKYCHDDIDYL